jgi:hypothetical protein
MIDGLVSKGFRVVPVPILWNHQTIDSYMKKFIQFYSKNKGEYNIVLGQSYAGMVALLSAQKLQPDELYLCSMSAFFAEDKDLTKRAYRIEKLGSQREKSHRSLFRQPALDYVNTSGTQVTLLHGEKEVTSFPYLVSQTKKIHSELKNSQLVVIPNCDHGMRHPNYKQGIVDAVE